MASEAEWHALHPASVAVNLLPRTWAFLRRSWVLVVALLFCQEMNRPTQLDQMPQQEAPLEPPRPERGDAPAVLPP